MSNFNSSSGFFAQIPNQKVKISKMKDNKPAVFADMFSSTIHSKIEMADLEVPFDKYLNECKLWNRHFQDKDFPATKKSLSHSEFNSMPVSQKTLWENFYWRKASEIFGDQYNIFSGNKVKIEPNDIKQGQLGDCYLLSALSALAERPQLILRLFSSQEKNSYGVFGVWLNYFGEWKNVVLDEYFPCLGDQKGPAFSRSNELELWVLLLEKAYAKVYGCYENIEGGNPSIALRDLTGAPYQNKDEGTPEEFWNFIKQNDDHNFILTCYTKKTQKIEEENELGLISSHAYSILDKREVRYQNGKIARLVQIRNPWGKVEWKGDWSDSSNLWSSELKKEFGLENNDDGVFWISIEDFVKYFQGVGIARVHEKYIYNSIKIDFKIKPSEFVRFELKEKMHCYFSINQLDSRSIMHKIENYVYSYGRILISQITENGLVFRGGRYGQDRDICLETVLEPGKYLMLVEVDWMQDHIKEVTLSSYSDCPFMMQSAKDEIDPLVVKRNIMKSYAETNPEDQKSTNYEKCLIPEASRHVNYEYGLLYLYYNNLNKKQILLETIEFTKLINLKVLPPFQKSTTYQISVPPEKDVVLLFSFVPSSDPTTQYGYKTSSKVDEYSSTKYKNLDPAHFNNLYFDPSVAHLRKDTHKIDLNIDPTSVTLRDPNQAEQIKTASASVLYIYYLAFEKSIITKLDTLICSRIRNWGIVYLVSLAISLFFVVLQFFKRANYWDLSIILYIALLGNSEGLTKERVRYCSLALFISGILDILWIFTFVPYDRWRYTSFDLGTESGVKGATIAFVFIYMIWRIWFFFITWRSAYHNQAVFPQIYSVLYDSTPDRFKINDVDKVTPVNQEILSNPPTLR